MKKILLICGLLFVFFINANGQTNVYIDNLDFVKNINSIAVTGEVVNAIDVFVAVGLYDNEKLIELVTTTNKNLNLTLPLNFETYQIKVFVWDNLDKPLCVSYRTNQDEIKIINTIEDRKNLVINNFYNAPFPNPTVQSDSINIGKIGYALTALYKNENIALANAYVEAACNNTNLSTNPITEPYKESETYFQMSIMARIYFDYQELLTDNSKNALKEYFWQFINHYSKYIEATDEFVYKNGSYYIEGSGNHHIVRRTAYLLGSQMLKDDENYKSRVLEDGYTVLQHFAIWQEYWQKDFITRGTKAYEIEYFSNGYDKYSFDCILTISDCAENENLRKLAKKYMDLAMTDMVVLSNNGLYGGARGRSQRTNEIDRSAGSYFEAVFWNNQSSWRIKDVINPLTGLKEVANRWTTSGISYHPNQIAIVSSHYKPPYILVDLAKNNKGSYEYSSNIIGKGGRIQPGITNFYMEFPSYYKRYSFVTPNYIVGSMIYNRNYIYSDIQQQNRYVGIHFANTKKDPVQSRVFVDTQRTYSRGFNDINSVAFESTMIVQSLPEAKYTNTNYRDIMLGFSENIKKNAVIDPSGWLFSYDNYGRGYIAVKPSKGSIERFDNEINPYVSYDSNNNLIKNSNTNVWFLLFTERNIPIVMQAGSQDEYGSFENFKNAIKNSTTAWVSDTEFEYIYSQNKITTFTDKTLPKINNQTINLESNYLFNSKYLKSIYNSGIIEIKNTKSEAYYIEFN